MSIMTVILVRVLLLVVAMDLAHVSGDITKCAPGCGTQDSDEYIDYCDGEDDIVTNMIGENSVYCQDLSITSGECAMVGNFAASNKQPLSVVNVPNGRLYTVAFKNSNPNLCYKAKELCVADIQCNQGEKLYYKIIDHDIEGESSEAENYPQTTIWCGDLLDDNQCLDYLHMTRTVYNDDYCTCGRVGVSGQTLASLGIPDEGMESNRITLTQRSNSDCRGFGSLVTVSCLDKSASRRRKRNTACKPTFVSPQLQRNHPRIPQPPSVRAFILKLFSQRSYPNHLIREIPHGVGFTYAKGIIKDCSNGTILFGRVSSLVRVNWRLGNQIKKVYNKTAPGSFHGYGHLIVAIRHKPYKKIAFFIGDEFPPEYRLSPNDTMVVNALLTRIAREQAPNATFKHKDGRRDQSTANLTAESMLNNLRRRRPTRDYNLTTADYVELSQKNMHSCQPIVNLVATAYAKVFGVPLYEDNPTTQSYTSPTTRAATKLATFPTRVTSSRVPSISPLTPTKAAPQRVGNRTP